MDVFDEIRARHEGRVMRLRNLPAPEPRCYPSVAWWRLRQRRAVYRARRYHACMLAGWWEAEVEVLFSTPLGGIPS